MKVNKNIFKKIMIFTGVLSLVAIPTVTVLTSCSSTSNDDDKNDTSWTHEVTYTSEGDRPNKIEPIQAQALSIDEAKTKSLTNDGELLWQNFAQCIFDILITDGESVLTMKMDIKDGQFKIYIEMQTKGYDFDKEEVNNQAWYKKVISTDYQPLDIIYENDLFEYTIHNMSEDYASWNQDPIHTDSFDQEGLPLKSFDNCVIKDGSQYSHEATYANNDERINPITPLDAQLLSVEEAKTKLLANDGELLWKEFVQGLGDAPIGGDNSFIKYKMDIKDKKVKFYFEINYQNFDFDKEEENNKAWSVQIAESDYQPLEVVYENNSFNIKINNIKIEMQNQ